MVSAEIIVDTRRKTKQGYPIKIRVFKSGEGHKYISLKVYSNTKNLKFTPFLNKRALQLEDEVNYCNENNFDFKHSLQILKHGIDKNKELEIFLLKQKIAELEKSSSIGMIEFSERLIKEREASNFSTRDLKDGIREVRNFVYPKDDIGINEITFEWVNNYIVHKRAAGANDGGISYYLRTLRSIFKESQKRESLNIKNGNPFAGHRVNRKNSKELEVPTIEDVKKLFDFKPRLGTTDLSKFKMQRNIDIWLFQFAIGGHDYIDIGMLRWESVTDRIKFKRHKNRRKPQGGRTVNNFLSKFALEVIEKYGTPEDERVFSWIENPKNTYKNDAFRRTVGRSLKRVSETLNLSVSISTKTPRYFFRTNAGELLIDIGVTYQILAHKSRETTFVYQRTLPNEIIDKEHKKVLNLIFDKEMI
ncbi:tyrosine-type recombinase/integrase [Aquimarina sp. 2-A2]|uniref:tyrosine-type recombinase/integrase n=1 Tax=Aquimarina sp. 2-A2 TaxID=3382644 RepID=UPI00387F1591